LILIASSEGLQSLLAFFISLSASSSLPCGFILAGRRAALRAPRRWLLLLLRDQAGLESLSRSDAAIPY
jgi:hypothetical protein